MAISHQAATVGGFNADVEDLGPCRLRRDDGGYSGLRTIEDCHALGSWRGSDGRLCAGDWYSSEEFKLGKAYADADGQFCLEFAGTMTAKAARQLPGVCDQTVETGDEFEQVLVFIVRGNRAPIRFYSHTKSDADVGYWFTSCAAEVPLATVTLVAGTQSA